MCWIRLWNSQIHHNNLKPLKNSLFHAYDSKEDIIDQFNAGCIVSGYHYPQCSKHIIVAFCKEDTILGLVALQADIGVEEQYESGMHF